MIRFVYFDMGNVLLYFDHRQAARQMAEVAGVLPDRVWDAVFASDLNTRYDAGQLSTDEFFEEFCRLTGSRPPRAELERAASAIFRVNVSIRPIIGHLSGAGYRVGLVSNTCPLHWEYVSRGRHRLLPELFDVVVLSYELRLLKPQPEFYAAATDRAGVRPEEIFFVDDLEENVVGARAFGWQAERYTTTAKLAADLRARGVVLSY